jgi:hypothetical protein
VSLSLVFDMAAFLSLFAHSYPVLVTLPSAMAIAAAGGYLAGRLAGRKPLLHAGLPALIFLALSPLFVQMLLLVASALFGGFLVSRQVRGREEATTPPARTDARSSAERSHEEN